MDIEIADNDEPMEETLTASQQTVSLGPPIGYKTLHEKESVSSFHKPVQIPRSRVFLKQ